MGLSAAKVTGCRTIPAIRRSYIRDRSGSAAHIFGSDRFCESRYGSRHNDNAAAQQLMWFCVLTLLYSLFACDAMVQSDFLRDQT